MMVIAVALNLMHPKVGFSAEDAVYEDVRGESHKSSATFRATGEPLASKLAFCNAVSPKFD